MFQVLINAMEKVKQDNTENNDLAEVKISANMSISMATKGLLQKVTFELKPGSEEGKHKLSFGNCKQENQ